MREFLEHTCTYGWALKIMMSFVVCFKAGFFLQMRGTCVAEAVTLSCETHELDLCFVVSNGEYEIEDTCTAWREAS